MVKPLCGIIVNWLSSVLSTSQTGNVTGNVERLSQFAFSSQESALHMAQRHLQRLGREGKKHRLSWRYNKHNKHMVWHGGFVILEFPSLKWITLRTNERFPRTSQPLSPKAPTTIWWIRKTERIQTIHKSQCPVTDPKLDTEELLSIFDWACWPAPQDCTKHSVSCQTSALVTLKHIQEFSQSFQDEKINKNRRKVTCLQCKRL